MLYFIGADKEVLQGEIVAAGAVPGVIKLCSSSNPELQAEAADLIKVKCRCYAYALPATYLLLLVYSIRAQFAMDDWVLIGH